jgi:hypothetical protein
LPAEIAHLLEEIQAKDQHIQDLRDVINTRDRSIQNFVRAQGGHVKNPKEDGLTKVIMANFDRIEILQAEKLGLSEKALRLVFTPAHNLTFYEQALTIPSSTEMLEDLMSSCAILSTVSRCLQIRHCHLCCSPKLAVSLQPMLPRLLRPSTRPNLVVHLMLPMQLLHVYMPQINEHPHP